MKTYKVTVDDCGTKCWYNEQGQLHREDGPAIEWSSGTKCWCRHGQLHREGGPAIEWSSGTKHWCHHGQLLTEAEFNARTKSCDGRVVEIDGKKYKLQAL